MTATTTARRALIDLMRPDVAALHEYVPVPTPESVAARFGIDPAEIIKLDANESPYGPPPAVLDLFRGGGPALGRYPDPDALELRRALARHVGAPVERIVAGNGSDELIDLVCRVFVAPGDRVVSCEPTFGVYRFAASQWGAEVAAVQRDGDFDVDLERLLPALDERVKLVFLCGPNNPSGNPLAEETLRAVLEATPALVVLDEAYAEFAGTSYVPLMEQYPNLCVLRTLSKYAGLAGLRVGYGIFPEPLAAALWKVKPPYNVNAAAQAAGIAAFIQPEWMVERADLLRRERERLSAALEVLPGVQVFPSAANFLLARFGVMWGPRSASGTYERLLSNGILVRRLTSPRLLDMLRISAGTPEQGARLLEVIAEAWN